MEVVAINCNELAGDLRLLHSYDGMKLVNAFEFFVRIVLSMLSFSSDINENYQVLVAQRKKKYTCIRTRYIFRNKESLVYY